MKYKIGQIVVIDRMKNYSMDDSADPYRTSLNMVDNIAIIHEVFSDHYYIDTQITYDGNLDKMVGHQGSLVATDNDIFGELEYGTDVIVNFKQDGRKVKGKYKDRKVYCDNEIVDLVEWSPKITRKKYITVHAKDPYNIRIRTNTSGIANNDDNDLLDKIYNIIS